MRKVHSVDLSAHIVDSAKRLVVVAAVEQLDLVRRTAPSYYHVLVVLAELASIQKARSVSHLQSLPVQCFIQLALARLPLLQLITLPPGSSQKVESAVSDSISTNVGTENAHDWFCFS